MAFPRSINLKRIAIGAMLAIGALSLENAQPPANAQAPAGAQGRGGGRGGGAAAVGRLYTPAAGAKDLKAVLFDWAWYMGMLRSSEQERDLMIMLESPAAARAPFKWTDTALQCNEISNQHQLPDVRRADQVHTGTGLMDARAPMSKSSVERMPGTKTFPAPNSSPVKARRRRCPQP